VLAVLAGLVQAALISVWPPRRWRLEREALTKVYRSLSADARLLAADPAAQVDPAQLLELREAFSKKDTPAGRRTPAYRDWHALPEQIAKTLMAFRGKAGEQLAVRDLLTAAADNPRGDRNAEPYGTTGRGIRTEGRRFRRRRGDCLGNIGGAARFTPVAPGDTLRFGRRHLSDWIAALKGGFDVARGHLYLSSPILRHAVRLAGAASAGAAIARIAEVPQGHWIPLTVLLAMRPETAHTYTGAWAGSRESVSASWSRAR
jgi:hypothetical protein